LVPDEEKFSCKWVQEDGVVKEAWEGEGGTQPNEEVIEPRAKRPMTT
jgi:hypothetical protein